MSSARGIHDAAGLNASRRASTWGAPGSGQKTFRPENVAEYSGDDRAGRWGSPARDPGLGEVDSSNFSSRTFPCHSTRWCCSVDRSGRGITVPEKGPDKQLNR